MKVRTNLSDADLDLIGKSLQAMAAKGRKKEFKPSNEAEAVLLTKSSDVFDKAMSGLSSAILDMLNEE